MDDVEIEKFVLASIANICNLDPACVASSSDVRQTGLDSMTLVAVIGLIEAQYGCAVDTEDMLQLFEANSVGDIVVFIQKIVPRAASLPAQP